MCLSECRRTWELSCGVFERMQKNLGIELWGVCSESRL